jgi:hypothetical protein
MFHASCHCGAIRLEIARRPRMLTECNCSICRRYGARWAYTTLAGVRIHARRGAFAAYMYGTKTFKYHRCRRCGCVTHYQRVLTTDDTRIAINARLMDPDDLAGIRIRTLDVRRKPKTPCPLTTDPRKDAAAADRLTAGMKGAFPVGLSQPPLRALAGAVYTRLDQLASVNEKELLKLHGLGPKAIRLIRAALNERILSS